MWYQREMHEGNICFSFSMKSHRQNSQAQQKLLHSVSWFFFALFITGYFPLKQSMTHDKIFIITSQGSSVGRLTCPRLTYRSLLMSRLSFMWTPFPRRLSSNFTSRLKVHQSIIKDLDRDFTQTSFIRREGDLKFQILSVIESLKTALLDTVICSRLDSLKYTQETSVAGNLTFSSWWRHHDSRLWESPFMILSCQSFMSVSHATLLWSSMVLWVSWEKIDGRCFAVVQTFELRTVVFSPLVCFLSENNWTHIWYVWGSERQL